MKFVYLLLCLLSFPALADIKAVDTYTQTQLLSLIASNKHLAKVRQDNCQLNRDISARAEILQQPHYQFLWAEMLLHGVCISKNKKLGMYWLNRAINIGFTPAMYQLANYYQTGKHVIADETLYRFWLSEAATLGHLQSKIQFAEHTLIYPANASQLKQAYLWLHELSYQRNQDKHKAIKLLKRLEAQIPPSVLAQLTQAGKLKLHR